MAAVCGMHVTLQQLSCCRRPSDEILHKYFGIGKIGRPAGYQVIGKRELDIEVLTCSSKSVQIFKRRKGKPYDLCNPNTARKSSNMCACNLLHAGTRRCD